MSIVSNTQAVLHKADRDTLKLVDEAFSFYLPGYEFSPKFRAGFWDGKKHFFQKKSGFFPLGLLPRLRELIPGLEVEDDRVVVKPPIDLERVKVDMLKGVEIRPYQLKAIVSALRYERGYIHMATGGGKSLCAAAIIKACPKVPVLIVVHTKALLLQMRRMIASYLGLVEDAIGEIGSGVCRIARITVGIVNSLHKRMKHPSFKRWLNDEVGIYIHDEFHHVRAGTHYDVAMSCHAQFRFGLSASPAASPEDQLYVEAPFGPVVARVTNEELIELGATAKPTVELYTYEPALMDSTWDWHQVYRDGLVQNAGRNDRLVRVVQRSVKKAQKVLVLVAQVWHGSILSAMFKALGIPHDFVHAKIPMHKIEAAKDKFRDHPAANLLIASPVFGEGVDIPTVDVLVVGDGGKSLKKILQQVGRGMRKKVGKKNVVRIIDFVDTGHLYLARHSEERIKIYENEKFEVVVR